MRALAILATLAALALFCLSMQAQAATPAWRYLDNSGTVGFTDTWARIPAAYRDSAAREVLGDLADYNKFTHVGGSKGQGPAEGEAVALGRCGPSGEVVTGPDGRVFDVIVCESGAVLFIPKHAPPEVGEDCSDNPDLCKEI